MTGSPILAKKNTPAVDGVTVAVAGDPTFTECNSFIPHQSGTLAFTYASGRTSTLVVTAGVEYRISIKAIANVGTVGITSVELLYVS